MKTGTLDACRTQDPVSPPPPLPLPPKLESMTVKKAYLFHYNIAQPSSVTNTLLTIRQFYLFAAYFRITKQ